MRRYHQTATEIISENTINYRECLAKTIIDEKGIVQPGYDVFTHCCIVGEVAKQLLNRLPVAINNALYPSGSALIAACHDIGKVSPTFFLKLQQAISANWQQQFPELEKFFSTNETHWGGHAGVSEATLAAVITEPFIAKIAGQHHGFSPNLSTYHAVDEVFGGVEWQNQRVALITALKQALGEEFPLITVTQARAIAGLTSVADWIGSGSFFEKPIQNWHHNVALALDNAGFITPRINLGLSFQDIFGAAYLPREAQLTLIHCCRQPGVYILEAPMGLGKTEAALYTAYQMLAGGQASGIYFALPTQLTSNKIYDRFNHFLSAILADDDIHRQALLLHGNAWLMTTEMGEEGQPGQSWFHQAKRGLLAPFAVGTLDQALMAVMNVKHGFVRAFGLAGKVVILDEVHSYDAYTSVILDELIAVLRELQCTVIILSATLSQSRRAQLLRQPVSSTAYPLVTFAADEVKELPITAPATQHVALHLTSMDSQPAREEALSRAEQGQQVLWIENSVAEAQQRYFDLAARCHELSIGCGLLHSRFTPHGRKNNEEKWVNLFGKAGGATRAQQGRILIGTQVLEQSLDIDADFLVTRFAPTDMLLQRFGRLWRHQTTIRPASAICEAWIMAPDLTPAIENPLKAFGPSAAVYSPYVLCRALEVWQAKAEENVPLRLPDDIRPLIEDTYLERQEQGYLAQWKQELFAGNRYRKGLNALQQLARLTLSQQGSTQSETKAQTRYSEEENAEVLLLRQLQLDNTQQQLQLTLLNGALLTIPWQAHRCNKADWRRLSATLMQQIVHCRAHQQPIRASRRWCQQTGLGNVFYLGAPEGDDAPFALVLVSDNGECRAMNSDPLSSHYCYHYRDDIGLQISKIKE